VPRFILAQPGLKSVIGHYFEFASLLLSCAETEGYEPVLAVHRNFQSVQHFPAHWRVLPVFARAEGRMLPPRRTYSGRRRAGLMPPGLPSLLDTAAAGLRARRWSQVADEYYRDYCELFRQISLVDGDQVLLASASELELAGLTQFLRDHPGKRYARWSFLFHNPVLSGREPDYGGQTARLELFRQHFRKSLTGLRDHDLRFYATTRGQVDQFNRLKVATFQVLPYPVNPALHPAAENERAFGPLRVVCAGGARREKGGHQLAELVAGLRADFLAPGKLQLLIQPDAAANTRKMLEQNAADLLETFDSYSKARESKAPLVLVPNPLTPDEYKHFVQNADVALLLYDATTYYARCSGVLLEMMAAGVPVIVPAGCWLADQIAPRQQQHLLALAESSALDTAPAAPANTQFTVHGASAAEFVSLDRPNDATELWLRFHGQGEAGTWLRVDCEQSESQAGRSAVVRAELAPTRTQLLFRARGVTRLRVYNAYADTPIELRDFEVRSLSARPLRPLGAVGLIAADLAQVPDLLAEIHSHYEHYRRSAREVSAMVRDAHHPRQALRLLLESAAPAPTFAVS
jgi:hypothetical protein